MPTISVEKADLLQLIGREYTIEQLNDLLPYIKGEIAEYNQDTDELKIELKDTNRPDLWSPEGIARQLRFTFEERDYSSFLQFHNTALDNTILVDETVQEIRPYVCAFIAKGVAVTEQFLVQMIQTQEKLCDGYGKKRELVAIGIYNLDAITFPVHYKAVSPHAIAFIPLGYDEKMDLDQILRHHPKGIEFGGIVREKPLYPILLDDNSDVLSFPPIINSRKSGEVVIGDQNLFIEITGMDMDMTLHALNILAYNFKDRGFEIEPVKSVYPYETKYGKDVLSPYPLTNDIEINLSLFEQYLGNSYTTEELQTYLKKCGLTVKELGASEKFLVSSYPYRQDYMHAVDVVEDLAISIGYDQFEPIMPERFTIGHLSPLTLFEDRVRDTMIGFGFEEVISNILTNKEDYREKVNNMFADLLEIENYMSETYSALRNTIIPSLLKVESTSSKSLYPHKIFEAGEVVERDETANHGCTTRMKLAALLSHAEANFSEIGSFLANLQYLMLWDTTIQAKDLPVFIKGRSGKILANDQQVGVIGETHPEILEQWGIKMPTVMFEVDLTTLFSLSVT